MRKRALWQALAFVGAVSLLAACGDDEETASTPTTQEETGGAEVGGEFQAYCDAARELDEQQSFPSPEQLDQLVATAPDEIKGDVEFVAGRFKESSEAGDPAGAFGDPEVEQRLEPIEEFEARECGLGGDEEEEEQDPSVTELDPAAARVEVIATEYAFELDPPAAGRTSFVMSNRGEESHIMVVARLAEGATLEQALQADDPEELLEEEYESDVANPGAEAVLTADVTPGEWAMVCYLPAADGEPHFLKGQSVPFTVE